MDAEQRNIEESRYWRNCLDAVAFGEFQKQEMYGREMGLWADYGDEWGDLDLQGKSVVDMGGGPWSMLLRCYDAGRMVVIDPIQWPPSVQRRYENYGIEFIRAGGEDGEYHGKKADEVWMYNVLQHVTDPAKVLHNAMTFGKKVRIFDWLYIPADVCHPHVLTPDLILNGMHGAKIERVNVKRMTEHLCNADAFIGVFTTGE